eukprot:scaffold60373_cov29-Prasinocladus_malaysianus.AAC.2
MARYEAMTQYCTKASSHTSTSTKATSAFSAVSKHRRWIRVVNDTLGPTGSGFEGAGLLESFEPAVGRSTSSLFVLSRAPPVPSLPVVWEVTETRAAENSHISPAVSQQPDGLRLRLR